MADRDERGGPAAWTVTESFDQNLAKALADALVSPSLGALAP
jgi:hypothetical protein